MTDISPLKVNGLSLLWESLPVLKVLRDFFSRRGVVAYLVGGILRDSLLERPIRDVDLAVQGNALSLARDLAKATGGTFVMLDEGRDIARVLLPPA